MGSNSKTIAVCSNRPRPSVQKGAKGNQWWRREVYHLSIEYSGRTLCNVDCREWLVIGEPPEDSSDCCERCAKASVWLSGEARP